MSLNVDVILLLIQHLLIFRFSPTAVMFSRFSRLPMVASGLFALTALAADNSTIDNTNSTCLSYGIDFVDGGSYFINTNSNTNFTCVSQFEGCNSDVADIILQDPNGNDYSCGTVPTTPDDVSEMATCAIEKSQMFSGEWIIFILGKRFIRLTKQGVG